jgi:hypothetical protein
MARLIKKEQKEIGVSPDDLIFIGKKKGRKHNSKNYRF